MTEDDATLLRRYADEKSEAAFAELVRRHLDLVYAVALRQTNGDAALAQDVAQTVFTALARKAASLASRPVLGGWLYRTTQFAAIDAVRAESRRRARETEAETMRELSTESHTAADWEKLRPTLDRIIGELRDDDRDAIVLRFFEGKSFADVGARLHLSENTARMRVERALDKLHALLARRGVTSTTSALAAMLANQPGVAAPAGFAASVTGAALGGAGVASGALWIFMSTKTTLGVVGLVAALATGAAVWQSSQLQKSTAALASADASQQALRAKVADLESRLAAASQRAQAADADNAKLLKVVEGLNTSHAAQLTAEKAPLTQSTVDARYKRAQELARAGDHETALKEFLWCFDEGMPPFPGYGGVRVSFLLNEIAKLGDSGLAALRERRDRARQVMLTNAREFRAAQEFAAINRTLKDDDTTLAVFDQLPPDDSRRTTLAGSAYELLVERRRYADALLGRSYSSMSSLFELNQQERPLPANLPNAEHIRKSQRDFLVKSTATNVEVLAGAGDVEHARDLATRLLANDHSDATKAELQEHLARAGHADLVAPPSR